MRHIWILLTAIFLLSLSTEIRANERDVSTILTTGQGIAAKFGVYEVRLNADVDSDNPYYDVQFQVVFTLPDRTQVKVDGFFDGDDTFKARAYCAQTGEWKWRSISNKSALNEQSGSFHVAESSLNGKIRKHSNDSHQFMYDNGEWFLHIGDTGYRYVVQSEPKWQEYIDEAAEMGATKIRTWFAQSRGTVEILFSDNRKSLNLPYWQEIEKRIFYAANEHPGVILQLIPYAEDTEEIKRYSEGDEASRFIAQYAQARWSSLPNIHWTITNDRQIVKKGPLNGRKVLYDSINKMGKDMAGREPWGTLITNHQARFEGYSHVNEPWSDIVTLEDIDQVDGAKILEYRKLGDDPVVLDEDRYELYRNPSNDRYFFRRFMWASLLSGGHGTYGGLRTYEPYDGGPTCGVQGYYRANRNGILSQGGHDFCRIHKFFSDSSLTLVGMIPDDAIAGNDPKQWKCIHNESTYIVYIVNPDGAEPRTDNPRIENAKVTISLPDGSYAVKWFNPRNGDWSEGNELAGGVQRLQPPKPNSSTECADWILWLEKSNK